jgi:hypothetical protein
MKKPMVILAIVLVSLMALLWLALELIPRSEFLMSMAEFMAPGLIPTSRLRENLKSSNKDLVVETLAVLTERKDPAALDLAIPLLTRPDDYVWLNAAHYAGSCDRQEAVPYLIKALRHTAFRSDNERVALLQKMTGQDYGNDFGRWQAWWLKEHPDFVLDWDSSLGFAPRIPEKNATPGAAPSPPSSSRPKGER